MKITPEVTHHIKNIKYYAGKIYDLVRKQLDEDCDAGIKMGVNTNSGTIRFDCLAAIIQATDGLDVYCDNILANLKHAESQDKLLFAPDKEEDISYNEQTQE